MDIFWLFLDCGDYDYHVYSYDRCSSIIDFGFSSGEDGFCGWSGSARDSIVLSEWCESPGFAPVSIAAGIWHILLGDTHLHSTSSDGSLTIEELVLFAQKHGLDYLFITDHNNYAHNQKLFSTKQLTLIPGVEWTHYKGYAGMLGSIRPFLDFIANSLEETCLRLKNAREEGALAVLNHPFVQTVVGNEAWMRFLLILWRLERLFDDRS